MQTQLSKLRRDLARLVNSRKQIRWGNGFSQLFVAIVGLLVVAFVCDITLDMSRAQRAVMLVLVGAGTVWAFKRLTQPWLRQREDIVQVALLVERQQKIDSDLVAALQFEQPEAANWGSTQLKTAVVNHVAEYSPKLDVFAGFSLADFQRRMAIAATVLIAVVITWVGYPAYVNAFLNRLLLGSAFYPTNTVIQKIVVNDTVVFDGQLKTDKVLVPFGHPVRFVLNAGGTLPSPLLGKMRVHSLDGAISTDVDLQTDAKETTDSSTGLLRGELPRLMDSVSFEAQVGDARTLPIVIEAVPLPDVDVRLDVTPPSFAAASEKSTSDAKGSAKWHISVVEGSSIRLMLEGLNKDLESVQLWIGDAEFRLGQVDGNARKWTLKSEGTPFGNVTQPLEYRLQVTDKQGLQLESPVRGTIRLKQDQPPRIAVSTRTTKIIPVAKPPITYSVQDDYGLSRVIAQVQVSKQNGEPSEHELEVAKFEEGKNLRSLKGTYNLDLSSLKLAKGDDLKVTFVAYDYRGAREPKRSFSEPLIFQVTDQAGILSGLLETDKESAKQLDAIIRRELGIGTQK